MREETSNWAFASVRKSISKTNEEIDQHRAKSTGSAALRRKVPEIVRFSRDVSGYNLEFMKSAGAPLISALVIKSNLQI